MVTRIRKWGNSLGLRLPRSAAYEAGVSEGALVEVRVKNGAIMAIPVRAPSYRLRELLAKIRAGNIHGEADAGAPRGRELL